MYFLAVPLRSVKLRLRPVFRPTVSGAYPRLRKERVKVPRGDVHAIVVQPSQDKGLSENGRAEIWSPTRARIASTQVEAVLGSRISSKSYSIAEQVGVIAPPSTLRAKATGAKLRGPGQTDGEATCRNSATFRSGAGEKSKPPLNCAPPGKEPQLLRVPQILQTFFARGISACVAHCISAKERAVRGRDARRAHGEDGAAPTDRFMNAA